MTDKGMMTGAFSSICRSVSAQTAANGSHCLAHAAVIGAAPKEPPTPGHYGKHGERDTEPACHAAPEAGIVLVTAARCANTGHALPSAGAPAAAVHGALLHRLLRRQRFM